VKKFRTIPRVTTRLMLLGIIGALGTTSLLSACSSVRTDAAEVNGEALGRDTFETLLDGYADAVPTSRLSNGAVDISIARGLLTDWVTTRILLAELTATGVEVADTDLEAARNVLEPQAGFSVAGPDTQDFYVLATAVRTVFTRTFGISAAQAREIYERGDSDLQCLRGILTQDLDSINAAALRLTTGENFATVAAEVSTDSTKDNGGILSDQQSGKECLSLDSLAAGAPEFIDALDGVAIGANTAPFELSSGGWVILNRRPFDEVADEVRDILGTSSADDARISAIIASDVTVSSEYGRWDPTTGTVTAR
jgi:hypothetical protein